MHRLLTPTIGVCLAVAAFAATAGPAWAQFQDSAAAGAFVTGAASVADPTIVQSAGPFICAPGRPGKFTLTWDTSTARDADGMPLVNYYRLGASVTGGPLSPWATTTPPSTVAVTTITYKGKLDCPARAGFSSAVLGVQAASSPTGFASAYATVTVYFFVQ